LTLIAIIDLTYRINNNMKSNDSYDPTNSTDSSSLINIIQNFQDIGILDSDRNTDILILKDLSELIQFERQFVEDTFKNYGKGNQDGKKIWNAKYFLAESEESYKFDLNGPGEDKNNKGINKVFTTKTLLTNVAPYFFYNNAESRVLETSFNRLIKQYNMTNIYDVHTIFGAFYFNRRRIMNLING